MAKKKTRGGSAAASPSPDTAPGKKPGRMKQIFEAYKQTQREDPSTLPWMLGALIGCIVLFSLLLWLILDAPIYGAFIGLAFGLIAALFILGRRAERAAYAKIEGQQGAELAAMQSIRRGWNVERDPAALEPRGHTMLFRASGRPGIALVVSGSNGPARKLMGKEVSRMERLFPNVPVHGIHVGRGEDEIPLPKLATYMQRMKPTLTKHEAGEVSRRLQAMPNPIRQAVPKGVDPMRARPNRRAMRGR
ncbi:DUF4191 domain-containing protein [Helcobacillus massiliensis]|uniref:DUF4191 family protein n=1 Tax=Helcobacillus massiliensis TaxID=521392 RepID=A0A839QUM5_9MICO|nr:DUF4191 domain-containing protein [Helcobacillus massiliensis]MBB3022480.1 hypothetical protein [Helcobacillus massiliensis]